MSELSTVSSLNQIDTVPAGSSVLSTGTREIECEKTKESEIGRRSKDNKDTDIKVVLCKSNGLKTVNQAANVNTENITDCVCTEADAAEDSEDGQGREVNCLLDSEKSSAIHLPNLGSHLLDKSGIGCTRLSLDHLKASKVSNVAKGDLLSDGGSPEKVTSGRKEPTSSLECVEQAELVRPVQNQADSSECVQDHDAGLQEEETTGTTGPSIDCVNSSENISTSATSISITTSTSGGIMATPDHIYANDRREASNPGNHGNSCQLLPEETLASQSRRDPCLVQGVGSDDDNDEDATMQQKQQRPKCGTNSQKPICKGEDNGDNPQMQAAEENLSDKENQTGIFVLPASMCVCGGEQHRIALPFGVASIIIVILKNGSTP